MNHAMMYEEDFYAWLLNNVQLLRQGRFAEADVEHIAEELESMGKRDKRELISRLSVLIMHLLKWQFQSDKQSRSWERTIDEQREQVLLILQDSPSLKYQIDQEISRSYGLAVMAAAKETGINKNVFPETCPYSMEQIFDENFYPAP